MTDQLDFEVRLEERLRARAAIASRPFDAAAIAHQAVLAGGRRRLGATLRMPQWPALRWVVLLLLTLAVAAAALVVGSRLLDRSAILPGRWTGTGPMQDLYNHDRARSALLLDGRVLFAGTYFESEVASSELFDPTTNTFSRTAGEMSGPRHGLSLTTLRDGRVLVAGGSPPIRLGGPPLAFAELFDPATGTFSPTGPLVIGREHHQALLLADGRVLVIGGGGAEGQDLTAAEIYDPGTGSWTLAGTMLEPAFMSASTLLPDGRVLVSGGMGPDGRAIARTELFDPSTRRFVHGSSMVTPRYGHATVMLADGRVLLVGGTDGADAKASVELYDPATGTFSTTGPLVTDRIAASAVRLSDGRVLVAGGLLANDAPRSAELYDPKVGTFQVTASASRMHIGQAHRLPDGRVLVTGGQPELFDPAATTTMPLATPRSDRTFIATGDPIEDRRGHSATRLPDGRVLIIAGVSTDVWTPRGDVQPSAELYDPATGSFTATGPLGSDQRPVGPDTVLGHAAVLLEDGRVLVIGDGQYSWRLQTFDPATGSFSDAGSLAPAWVNVAQPITAVTLVDGRIVVFGPRLDVSSTWDSQALAYLLDPAQLQVTKLADLAGCQGVHGALALANGRVVVQCGGEAGGARVFDPATGALSPLDTVSSERRSMTVLADGRVLLTDGRDDPGVTVYDPATGEVERGTLPAQTSDPESVYSAGPTLTVLRDGRVLSVRGRDAAIWDPRTGAASALIPPLAIRDGHTATPLNDGRVLLVGGTRWPTDRNDPRPPDAELFDPAALP